MRIAWEKKQKEEDERKKKWIQALKRSNVLGIYEV